MTSNSSPRPSAAQLAETTPDVLPYFNQPGPSGVPIVRLGIAQKAALLAHFLALEAADRYLRFGFVASDEQIRNYVDRIDFARDEIFGVFNRKLKLLAVAHIAVSCAPEQRCQAELGVSVLPAGRRRGVGTRLFQRAAMAARNRGIRLLTMQCLTQNAAMMHIARRAGMQVHMAGSETQACLVVPRRSLLSYVDAWLANATGQMDLAIKLGLRRPHVG